MSSVIKTRISVPAALVQVTGPDTVRIRINTTPGFGISGATRVSELSDIDLSSVAVGHVLVKTATGWESQTPATGVTAHDALSGLNNDDHSQYHNDTRGDARYYQKAEVNTALAGKANSSHTHTKSQISDFNEGDYATAAQGAKADSALQSLPSNVVLDNDSRLTDARTPTAHTHTKAQITDFSDSDYATAAQGAKADSALQALPSNAIVEGDARLTDARTPTAHSHDTLYYPRLDIDSILGNKVDTTDSRLSDARTPTAHVHAASDITTGTLASARISEASVTQHEAALSLTVSQLSDFNSGDYVQTASFNTQVARIDGNDTDIAALQSEQAAQNTAISGKVSLTGTETIAGNKTFTGASTALTGDLNVQGTVTVQGDLITKASNEVNIGDAVILLNSDETGAPTANAGFDIERGTGINARLQWNEATDEWEAGLVGSTQSLAFRPYVDGQLAGKADVSHTHTKSQITDFNDADYATAAQGALADSALQSIPANVVLTNDARLSDARTPTTHTHTKAQITDFDDADYATAAQGAKADTALQSIPANVVLTDDSRLTDARTPTAHTHTKAQISDFNDADYATAAQGAKADSALQSIPSNVVLDNDSRLTDARTPTAHTHTKAQISDFSDGDYATAAQGTKADSALQSVALNDITDVDLSGAADGQALVYDQANSQWVPVTISGGGTFNGGTVTANIEIEAADANSIIDATTGTPRVTMNRVGVKTFELQGLQTRGLIRRYHETGGGENRLEMYDDSTRFDHDVRGVSTTAGSAATSFATKDYVDANSSGAFNGGTITENLAVEKVSAKLEIKSTGNTNPTFNLFYNGTAVQQMYFIPGNGTTTDHIRWVKTGGIGTGRENTLRLFSDYGQVESDWRLTSVASDGDAPALQLFEHVNNGFNHVDLAAPDAVTSNYRVLFPANPPTATGQNLQVTGISGSTITLGWI